MNDNSVQRGQIGDDWAGKRLDHVLADMFPDYSRSRLQQWLKDGQITVNGEFLRAKDKVAGGEEVELYPQLECDTDWQAQDIPLDILHADRHILVLSKPPGLVVHPAAGNPDGTLQNGLLHFDPQLASIPRSGIVQYDDRPRLGHPQYHLGCQPRKRKMSIQWINGPEYATVIMLSQNRQHLFVVPAGTRAIPVRRGEG